MVAAVARVDCVECCTPRLLFQRALAQLAPSSDGAEDAVKCEAPADFMRALRRLEAARADAHGGRTGSMYIVFDRAERLREHGPTLFSSLLRIQELVRFP